MSTESGASTTGEKRLDEIIAAYLQAAETGQAPDRKELLARHLDLAAELAAFFADQDQFDRLAAPLRAMRPTATPQADAVAPGTRVGYFGDYELLEEIARGGMGIVYKARQRSLNRVVALKMIRAAHDPSAADVRRFHTEAETAANLDHPHIVPIYEEGEFQGQHYFSMKLIDGGNLTQNLARLKDDPRGIARLMAAVARAVHYAHQRGLLHRDLKPANILLDSRGQPHVSDFGLAKWFAGGSGLTQSGAIVGTPSYMPPEQASGRTRELTTAADVYSLGAILYELLTGRPPFKADTPLDTLRQVTDLEPVRPKAISPRVNRDLETICLKCLEKEPARRYATAADLADDLQRFLDDVPIRARRPGVVERTRKWLRRHPGSAAAVGLLIPLLFLVLLLATIRVERQRRAEAMARTEAEYQRHMAEEQQAKAEANFQTARQAVDQLLTRVGEDALADVPRTEPLRRTLLTEALAFYRGFLQEKGTDPQVRRQTAWAYRRVGDVERRLGKSNEAMESYRQAITLTEELARDFPEKSDYQADLAQTYQKLGSLLKETGWFPEAEATYRKALALWEPLVKDPSAAAEHRAALAAAFDELGQVQADLGRTAEAESMHRRALAIQEKLATDAPKVAAHRSALATTLLHLGRLLQSTRRPAEAEATLHRALALLEQLVKDQPTVPDFRHLLARAYAALGEFLAATGRNPEAQAAEEKALALLDRLVAEFPATEEYRQTRASVADALRKRQGRPVKGVRG